MVSQNGVPKTILVGEDDREVRECLDMMLRCKGYEVVTACDGEEDLNCMRAADNPDLIVLDIRMPNKAGFEALRETRSADPDIPVVMLSGLPTPLNVVNAIKNGATDFLPKPLNHEDLGRVLQQALQQNARPKPVTEI